MTYIFYEKNEVRNIHKHDEQYLLVYVHDGAQSNEISNSEFFEENLHHGEKGPCKLHASISVCKSLLFR